MAANVPEMGTRVQRQSKGCTHVQHIVVLQDLHVTKAVQQEGNQPGHEGVPRCCSDDPDAYPKQLFRDSASNGVSAAGLEKSQDSSGSRSNLRQGTLCSCEVYD
jgi:hypothetical protein